MLSNEEREIRRGKFSGSEIHKLLVGGTRKMTEAELAQAKIDKNKRKTVDVIFGDTALTYIAEKAYDTVFGINLDDELNSFDIRRGNDLEPLAFKKFKELKALEFIEVEDCTWFAFGGNAGATLFNNMSFSSFNIKNPTYFLNLAETLLWNHPHFLKSR